MNRGADPTEFVQAAEAMEDTADYLSRYGWQRHLLGLHGRPRCVNGALRSACGIRYMSDGDFTVDQAARERYRVAVVLLTRYLGEGSVEWNDWHVKDQQEVEDTLREAAKHFRIVAESTERSNQ